MSSFTRAQAQGAPIIDTRERVELIHPGNYLVVQHADSGRLYRVAALQSGATQDEITTFVDRLAAIRLAVVPHCQQVFTNADGLKQRMLAQCFWTLPIFGEDATAGLCAGCRHHAKIDDTHGRCDKLLGAITPLTFGCLTEFETRRDAARAADVVQ